MKTPTLINYNVFMTRDKKFYYVNDIKTTLKYLNINDKGKKSELLDRLSAFYNTIKNYNKNIDKIHPPSKPSPGWGLGLRASRLGTVYRNTALRCVCLPHLGCRWLFS